MAPRPDHNRRLREQAWVYGRDLFGALVTEYQRGYSIAMPPPPALIVGELLTDFMGAGLTYDPLPHDRYAQTEWLGGRPVVTVNSLTAEIEGVKDAAGVQNVAMLHEGVHVDRDTQLLRVGPQAALPGFVPAPIIVCRRATLVRSRGSDDTWLREFWAEEAGRAAAISYAALSRSGAFRSFARLTTDAFATNAAAWRLLYEAASDIGVNSSALVKQLQLEGWIAVEREDGRNILRVQPAIGGLLTEVA